MSKRKYELSELADYLNLPHVYRSYRQTLNTHSKTTLPVTWYEDRLADELEFISQGVVRPVLGHWVARLKGKGYFDES